MDERLKLFIGRTGVVAMGIIAYVLAIHAEGVYNLVKDASSFGSAEIFVVLMFGLFTKFGQSRSAVGALLSGAIVWFVSHYLLKFPLSYVIALGASLLSYIALAATERFLLHTQIGTGTGGGGHSPIARGQGEYVGGRGRGRVSVRKRRNEYVKNEISFCTNHLGYPGWKQYSS